MLANAVLFFALSAHAALQVQVLRDEKYAGIQGLAVKKLGLVLPQTTEIELMQEMAKANVLTPTYLTESNSSFALELHILQAEDYELYTPLDFNADTYTTLATDYARREGLDGVISMNCFPSLVAAAIKGAISDEMHFAGPSFGSVATLGTNKYYMRKLIASGSELKNYEDVALLQPDAFPVVLKLADTQFYTGTFKFATPKELHTFLDGEGRVNKYAKFVMETTAKSGACDLTSSDGCAAVWNQLVADDPAMATFPARQAYYYKHLPAQTKKDLGISAPHDVQLLNLETWVEDYKEYQIEVVVDANQNVIIHDTGDLTHAPEEDAAVTLFKLPFSLGSNAPGLKDFMKGVVDTFVDAGFTSAAMDVEFYVKTDSSGSGGTAVGVPQYFLGEVNTRYSYMGAKQYGIGKSDGLAQVQKVNPAYLERNPKNAEIKMRNFDNRVAMALGEMPPDLPTMINTGVATMAAMIHGNGRLFQGKQVAEVFNPNPTTVPEADDYDAIMEPTETIDPAQSAFGGWMLFGGINYVCYDDINLINAQMAHIFEEAFAPGLALIKGRGALRPYSTTPGQQPSSSAPYLLPRLTAQSQQLEPGYLMSSGP